MQTLTRTTPARTETLTVLWCKSEFINYGVFKFARTRARMDCQSTCFWCGRQFVETDTVGLACFDKKGNKLVCQECVMVISGGE